MTNNRSSAMQPSPYVTYSPEGRIKVHTTNRTETKLAIRELKAKKKELALDKRTVMQQQREIRAAYTRLVRQRGSKVVGAGEFGKIIRVFQTADRDAARAHLANLLAPLQKQQSDIEATVTTIDRAIIYLESRLS